MASCSGNSLGGAAVSSKGKSGGDRLRLRRTDLLAEPCGADAVERGELGIEQRDGRAGHGWRG
jgi:hypothetical protein